MQKKKTDGGVKESLNGGFSTGLIGGEKEKRGGRRGEEEEEGGIMGLGEWRR